MANATDKMMQNINFSAIGKATELKNRIWFTLAALVVYRIGTYIPLPGINPQALAEAFRQTQSGILGLFNMFSGGAVGRLAIFALAIMPYISASIIIQLLTSIVPELERLKKDGEQGRKQINQYTRYLTVFLATFQAYGIVVGLERSQGGIVLNPGLQFEMIGVITLVGGTMFLLWLGEQITARGIGNGTSMIIFAGIIAELPGAMATLFDSSRKGDLSAGLLIFIILLVIATIAFIVFMERAQRRLLIQYPKRQVGNQVAQASSSHLPLKLNTSGVIPPIFASSLLLIPATLLSFQTETPEWLRLTATALGHGQPLYMLAYAALIIFFCFFYTAIVFNPTETADNLKKQGGFIPGIRPGEKTAEYIDKVLTRITVIGAAYITLVCLLPELMISKLNAGIYFGGTSLLIVVSVTMDTFAQIQSHLFAHQYEGLIKKSQLGRKK